MYNVTIKPNETILLTFVDSSGKEIEIKQHFNSMNSKDARVAIDAPKTVSIKKENA